MITLSISRKNLFQIWYKTVLFLRLYGIWYVIKPVARYDWTFNLPFFISRWGICCGIRGCDLGIRSFSCCQKLETDWRGRGPSRTTVGVFLRLLLLIWTVHCGGWWRIWAIHFLGNALQQIFPVRNIWNPIIRTNITGKPNLKLFHYFNCKIFPLKQSFRGSVRDFLPPLKF